MARTLRLPFRAGSRSGIWLALASLLIGLLPWPVPAQPASAGTVTPCSLAGGTMTIVFQEDWEVLSIGRTEGGEFTGAAAGGSCAGATVEEVDQVVVTVSGAGDDGADGPYYGDNQTLRIDLSAGPFAPGATPEATGTPEIEFDVDLRRGVDDVEIIGSAGPDAFRIGGSGNVNLNGDDDADVVAATERLTIYGRDGDDDLRATGGLETGTPATIFVGLSGGAGHDWLVGGAGVDDLYGGHGNDLLDGRARSDGLYGNTGRDTLFGRRGDDSLLGGLDADELVGGAGPDFLAGRGGPDHLVGGTENDFLFGEAGNDSLDGGNGRDRCHGGPGIDSEIRCEF